MKKRLAKLCSLVLAGTMVLSGCGASGEESTDSVSGEEQNGQSGETASADAGKDGKETVRVLIPGLSEQSTIDPVSGLETKSLGELQEYMNQVIPDYNIEVKTVAWDGWIQSLLPAVMTNAMYIFFIKSFCDGLPDDLYEAARVDGAGIMITYGRIYFPLMKPIVATIVVLDAINIWNDMLWPMVVLTQQEKYTVQIGLQMYNSGAAGTTHAGTALALSVISIIPLSILYIFCQKYIVQSIAFSGMKQ